MTRDKNFSRPNVTVNNDIHSIMNIDPSKFVYLIGGGELFYQYYNQCAKIYVTKWHKKFENVDTFMPNLDKDENWVLAIERKVISDDGIDYSICEYMNKDFMRLEI